MKIDKRILKAAFDAVRVAVSGDSSRPSIYDAIRVEPDGERWIRLIGTDGSRLHVVTVELAEGSAHPTPFVVTRHTLDMAIRGAAKSAVAFLDPCLGTDAAAFPDVSRVIPPKRDKGDGEAECWATFDPSYVADAMTAAAKLQKATGATLLARVQLPPDEYSPMRVDAEAYGNSFLAVIMGKRP